MMPMARLKVQLAIPWLLLSYMNTVLNDKSSPCFVAEGCETGLWGFPGRGANRRRTALTLAARGGKADTAKPFKGVDGGVFEIALKHRGNAYRVIYAVQIGADLWVIDAFQKKSKQGIKTPQIDVERIRLRVKRLREQLASN
jgi:phage-related protein